MRRIQLEDGSQYLPVKYRIADFHKKYPKGKIFTKLLRYNWQNANSGVVDCTLIKAYVYKDETTLLAEAYAQRQNLDVINFLESAETIAIGRALSDAGFNIFSEDLGENPCDRKILLDDGSYYLKAGFRIAWARREMPDMVIHKEILVSTPYQALVKATIENDGEQLVTSHALRYWNDTQIAGHFVIESAETAAVARALSILGYDLPPEDSHELDERDQYSESPIAADCYRQYQSERLESLKQGFYPGGAYV